MQQPQRLAKVMRQFLAVDVGPRIGQQARLVEQEVGIVDRDQFGVLHVLHFILRRGSGAGSGAHMRGAGGRQILKRPRASG